MHRITSEGECTWSYGSKSSQQDTRTKHYKYISFFDWKPAGGNLGDYLKLQYKEWIINKIVLTMYNFDGGVNEYFGKDSSFDIVKRMPTVLNCGTNNYYWSKNRLSDSRYHVRVFRPTCKEDLSDCKLDSNWLEHFDIVNAKDKQGSKRKMLKYVYYPKCTKPLLTATTFFDKVVTLKDVLMLMQPKDFATDYSEYVLFGFGPWNEEMFPDSDDMTRSVDFFFNFEYSMKIYYSLFKRDSVTS